LDLFGVKACEPLAMEIEDEFEGHMKVDKWQIVGFALAASASLVLLFFFMKYMIYFIIFAFATGGATWIAQLGGMCLEYCFPSLKYKPGMSIPCIGPLAHAEVLAGIPGLIVGTCWVILRNTPYGWPLQDFMGAGFLCFIQHSYKVLKMKTVAMLLVAMFFFDIFWVFISPVFFHESVMVRVAQGGGTGESVPMLLRIPNFGDPFGSYRLLGFGLAWVLAVILAALRPDE